MERVRCMIVDDQIESIKLINNHIKNVSLLSLEYSTSNSIEALSYLDHNAVDCIFVDVEMPDLTGLEFIEAVWTNLKGYIPKIILVTGYDKYALKGFDYGVFDYLLKPVSFKRFKITCNRLVESFANSSFITRDFFFTDVDGKKVKIFFSDIHFIEGAGNYTYLVTSLKKFVCYRTMTSFEEALPKGLFCRVHKSFIISISNIEAVRANEVFMNKFANSKIIPIGTTYKEQLLKVLGISA
jgi:DNA-binding LytR/AlgR family response regulator